MDEMTKPEDATTQHQSDPADGSDPESVLSRRGLLKRLTLLPLAAGLSACSEHEPSKSGAAASPALAKPYIPTFFNPDEWSFLVAACDRLIPADEHGPGAVELGVPEFMDRHMQTPYASGDIWYLQGPFVEAASEFGYQGRLALRDILRVGMHAVDTHCKANFVGKTFAQLDHSHQEALLRAAEAGTLQLRDIGAQVFFAQLLAETRNGYFADPRYGGNKGMGSWKMIGYPGVRADFTDWVEVRDKPYPLPPVDLSGRRG
jgi:gluconate 2-dehydrogenase gamma chain